MICLLELLMHLQHVVPHEHMLSPHTSGTHCLGGWDSCLSVCCQVYAVAAGSSPDTCCLVCHTALQVVAFGQGHNSWVSRVAFDPESCKDTRSSTGIGPAAAASQLHEKLYRLGSVSQDTMICLWDLVEVVEDAAAVNSGSGQTGGLR